MGTQKSEPQKNGGKHTPINSDMVHLQNLMNITIHLETNGHQVLKLCLEKILPLLQH